MFFVWFGVLVFLDATKPIEGWMFVDLCTSAKSDLQFFSLMSRHKFLPIWILMSYFDATNLSPFNALNHIHLLCLLDCFRTALDLEIQCCRVEFLVSLSQAENNYSIG